MSSLRVLNKSHASPTQVLLVNAFLLARWGKKRMVFSFLDFKISKKGIMDLIFCFAVGETEAQETVAQAHVCNCVELGFKPMALSSISR